MGWMMDTYSNHMGYSVAGVVTGKPVLLGGSVGRREATGRGVAFLANRAMDSLGIEAHGATAIVQGFGNVGSVTAQCLARFGTRIVGVSDVDGGIWNLRGLDFAALEAHLVRGGRLAGFPGGEPIGNAGGVVVSYFEWVQNLQSFFWSETEVTDRLYRILEGAFAQTFSTRFAEGLPPRQSSPDWRRAETLDRDPGVQRGEASAPHARRGRGVLLSHPGAGLGSRGDCL